MQNEKNHRWLVNIMVVGWLDDLPVYTNNNNNGYKDNTKRLAAHSLPWWSPIQVQIGVNNLTTVNESLS